MQIRNIFRNVRPFISATAVTATAIALVFAIYFTQIGTQWITFLTGILVAATLAEATGRSRAEWIAKRRTAQLTALKIKSERDAQLRKIAEKAVADGKPRLHLIDEVLPTMIAFIDNEGCCQYHNRAFLDWLHLRSGQVNGKHLRSVLGSKVYQEIATATRQSLDGHAVRYELAQITQNGALYKLSIEHLPHFGETGKVTGFYMLINDITSPGDVKVTIQPESQQTTHSSNDTNIQTIPSDGNNHQDMYIDSLSEQITGQKDAHRILETIERGDFHLFCQLIVPMSVNSGEAEHYEILVRLMEEEENMMPPGAFFPLAEKYGLMGHLDRWVVQHVAEWATRQIAPNDKRKNSMLFINVSSTTIADPSFTEFLQSTLLEYDVPSAILCFEIPDSELASRTHVVAEFARRIRQSGCCIAISGFGRDRVLFDLIRGIQVDFLKIDGNIIFNIHSDPVNLAKITAINQVAKNIGIKTIAELVESEETVAKLKEIGIDFAQGFGISRPQPLAS